MEYLAKIKANTTTDEYYMYLKLNRANNDKLRKEQGKHVFKGDVRQIHRPCVDNYWEITPITTILDTLYPHSFFTQHERLTIYLKYIYYYRIYTNTNTDTLITVYNRRLNRLSPYDIQLMLS